MKDPNDPENGANMSISTASIPWAMAAGRTWQWFLWNFEKFKDINNELLDSKITYVFDS